MAWGAAVGIGAYGLYDVVTDRDGATRASTLLHLTPTATALWAAALFAHPLRPVTGLRVTATARPS